MLLSDELQELFASLRAGEDVETEYAGKYVEFIYREYNEFTADMEPGLGVGFLRLSADDRRAIGAFTNVRQPLLYEME